jgi:NAD(P)-dependent dehydrogenase (short-subunit alcohol dehydrogenase family)
LLQDRVALITGGGRGIGQVTAVEMAKRGAKGVAVTDVNREGGEETVKLVRDAGGEAEFFECDLRDSAAVEALMPAVAERFGGIDILHNNAGLQETTLTTQSAVHTLSEEVWDAVMDVNLKAMWLTTKFATPFLRESEGAAIVNCSSLSGLIAFPMGPAYSASKGGVLTLTQATALDLAEFGIRCNCYSPGVVDTPMSRKYIEMAPDKDAAERILTRSHLVPRMGQPIEIARLVCFLASDESSFITGANYVIDGGSMAWRGTRDA